MAVTYEPAKAEVWKLAVSVMEKYHGDMVEVEAQFEVMFAYGPKDKEGQTTGPAIKVRGFACYASVRLFPLRDRAAGRPDFEMLLDGDHYDEWSAKFRRAIFDHELYHVEPLKSKEGVWRTDDVGRPVMRLRPHDIEHGWFSAVAGRHGAASVERIQAAALLDVELKQLYLPNFQEAG